MTTILAIEALTERDGKVLLVQTEAIITPHGMYPPVMHIIKNPKKVREEVGDQLIRSVKWIDAL
jgi:hypothetical protein